MESVEVAGAVADPGLSEMGAGEVHDLGFD